LYLLRDRAAKTALMVEIIILAREVKNYRIRCIIIFDQHRGSFYRPPGVPGYTNADSASHWSGQQAVFTSIKKLTVYPGLPDFEKLTVE